MRIEIIRYEIIDGIVSPSRITNLHRVPLVGGIRIFS